MRNIMASTLLFCC